MKRLVNGIPSLYNDQGAQAVFILWSRPPDRDVRRIHSKRMDADITRLTTDRVQFFFFQVSK